MSMLSCSFSQPVFFLNFKTFQKFQLFQLFVTNLNLTVFVFVIRVLFGMSTLFTFCYFGKLSTTSFENMADCMYENNWYEWSIESQKHIVIMIMNAQRSIYYHGFGVALLNLETFTKVSYQSSHFSRNLNQHFFIILFSF